MTIPIEEYHALSNTMRLLYELIDPKKSPDVPKNIRNKAALCLRHFPTPVRLDEIYQSESYNKIPKRY
jgi:hypothetical protein